MCQSRERKRGIEESSTSSTYQMPRNSIEGADKLNREIHARKKDCVVVRSCVQVHRFSHTEHTFVVLLLSVKRRGRVLIADVY